VTDHIAVAIDGPAASGKSSTAKAIARALGYRHVDSGSLYRAATAARARRGGDPKSWTEESVLEAAREVTLAPVENGFIPLIDGDAADSEMRGETVTGSVSLVARMPRVREWVNAQVRRAGENHDVVVDGRDIGSVVFPRAQLKVFLVADAGERARRRLKEKLHREPTSAEIVAEISAIQRRDAMDAAQSAMANDAVKIDTTNLTQEDQVERIVGLARSVAALRTATDRELPTKLRNR
jgi:cytidylate kinase